MVGDASEGAGQVIVSVAVRIWASLFEYSGGVDGPGVGVAGGGKTPVSTAAVLVSVEFGAGAEAGNGVFTMVTTSLFQIIGADVVDFSSATDSLAVTVTIDGFNL